jgi:dihydrofolate reductase
MSLDGMADDPGEGDWFGDADHTLLDNLGAIIEAQDTVLLGRRTYEKWVAHWPGSDLQPFADFINQTPKVVFSTTPPTQPWAATTHVAEPAADYVAELKLGDGGDIGVHGSLTLAQSLLEARLVDELRLVVAPRLAGGGRRLFDGVGDLQRFELVESSRSGGCLLLHYRSKQ